MGRYSIREEGFEFEVIEADSASEALDQVDVSNGDYDTSEGTVWTTIYAFLVPDLAAAVAALRADGFVALDIDDGDATNGDDALFAPPATYETDGCDEANDLVGRFGCAVTLSAQGELYLSQCDESGSRTFEIEAEEPSCTKGKEHDWQSPFEIVGGLEENPGVWGNGGGVVITECCMNCGCARVTDTWAQNPCTGEQGLHSVSYEPGEYADEIDRANEAERADYDV